MPTYEYVCRNCTRHVEVVQSFRDDPLTTCSNCGGQLRKVFGTAGIIFKGSGYYVNDSRAKPAGDKPKSGGGDKPKSGGGHKKPDSGASAGSGSSDSATAESA
jgi:putative FmdB family regulatory protein